MTLACLSSSLKIQFCIATGRPKSDPKAFHW
jgi:hypothetical protein